MPFAAKWPELCLCIAVEVTVILLCTCKYGLSFVRTAAIICHVLDQQTISALAQFLMSMGGVNRESNSKCTILYSPIVVCTNKG